MINLRRLLLAALLATIAFLASACSSKDPSSIPWSRPADWEGRIPGMGT